METTNNNSYPQPSHLFDYESLVISAERTVMKCKAAAEILSEEHFEINENDKDFRSILACTYHRSEIVMEMILDYLNELGNVISDIDKLVHNDFITYSEQKKTALNTPTI